MLTGDAVSRLTAYLAEGGMLNSEIATQEDMRDLLIDARIELLTLLSEKKYVDRLERDLARLMEENEALRKDAEILDWLEAHFFEHHWNATLGAGSRTYWQLVGHWRHILRGMEGVTLREALLAAIKEGP